MLATSGFSHEHGQCAFLGSGTETAEAILADNGLKETGAHEHAKTFLKALADAGNDAKKIAVCEARLLDALKYIYGRIRYDKLEEETAKDGAALMTAEDFPVKPITNA